MLVPSQSINFSSFDHYIPFIQVFYHLGFTLIYLSNRHILHNNFTVHYFYYKFRFPNFISLSLTLLMYFILKPFLLLVTHYYLKVPSFDFKY